MICGTRKIGLTCIISYKDRGYQLDLPSKLELLIPVLALNPTLASRTWHTRRTSREGCVSIVREGCLVATTVPYSYNYIRPQSPRLSTSFFHLARSLINIIWAFIFAHIAFVADHIDRSFTALKTITKEPGKDITNTFFVAYGSFGISTLAYN